MSHVDEGLIHAWLEDQLPPDDAERVAHLVATDAAWGAAAAEARGLIAASSRVLGALDSAPSAGVVVGTLNERTERKSGSWARKYWLRAAAAILLVAGISGVWFSGPGFGDDVTIQVVQPKDAVQNETKSVIPAETPAPARAAPAPQVAQTRSLPRVERQSAASVPTPPPVAAMRDQVAAAAKSVANASDAARNAAGTGAGTGAAGAIGTTGAGVTGVAEVAGIAAGAGRGAGGRAGRLTEQGVVGQRNELQRVDMMKVFAASPPDSVFRGCWIPLDTVRRESREATERDGEATMVLRFTQPVVTDLGGVRVPPPAASPPPPSPISALRAAPARARVQHATARMKDDSTLVAEWLNADNRTTQLTFRLRGDTLRGTTSSIAGDLVIVGSVLVAVRGQCP
jgi:hypothetical protein